MVHRPPHREPPHPMEDGAVSKNGSRARITRMKRIGPGKGRAHGTPAYRDKPVFFSRSPRGNGILAWHSMGVFFGRNGVHVLVWDRRRNPRNLPASSRRAVMPVAVHPPSRREPVSVLEPSQTAPNDSRPLPGCGARMEQRNTTTPHKALLVHRQCKA